MEEFAWANALVAAVKQGDDHPGWEVMARVKGKWVKAFIDTGCSHSLIRADPK